LEAQLSLFKPASEISRVNAGAAYAPVRVSPPVFRLLQRAQQISRETDGAFDITIAPLMQCWGFLGGPGKRPEPAAIAEARDRVGMHRVHLDEASRSVRFEKPGMMIDLGAIGKGYAIDCAVECLQEAGVQSALVHGGTSTAYGIGSAPDGNGWQIAIPSPATMKQKTEEQFQALSVAGRQQAPPKTQVVEEKPFAVVGLRDSSLSVSAVWGKFFHSEGRNFGHVIDPRSGEPTALAVLSAVVSASATETDALSTALLTLGPEGHPRITALRPELKALVVAERGDVYDIRTKGIRVENARS
jgi:FAD:protein FMN transferase